MKNEERRTKNERFTRVLVVGLLLVAALGAVPVVHADTGDSAHAGRVPFGERLAGMLRTKGLSPEAVVMLISTLPVVELRGAIPVGNNLFHLPLWKTLVLVIIGNMIPMLLLVLVMERVVGWLSHIPVFKRFFDWLFRHTRGRSGAVARSEFWGLAVFVGIPLPGFGVWTGAVLAVVMDMPFWRSMLAAFVGVLFAAAIVTTLSVLGFWGAVIAGVVLTAVLAQAIIVGFRRRRAERVAP